MADAWIVSTARTPIGTAFKGSLADVDPIELGTVAVAEAVRRRGIDPERVDDVVLAESRQGGGDIARHVAIRAGLMSAPGLAHNRHCAGGLAAITTAAETGLAPTKAIRRRWPEPGVSPSTTSISGASTRRSPRCASGPRSCSASTKSGSTCSGPAAASATPSP